MSCYNRYVSTLNKSKRYIFDNSQIYSEWKKWNRFICLYTLYNIWTVHLKSVLPSRITASPIPGSLTCSTKKVSLPAATVHNYNNDGQNRKGIKINHKNISFLGRHLIVTSDDKYTKQENKNNKGVETSCRKILEFEKDRRTSKVSLG